MFNDRSRMLSWLIFASCIPGSTYLLRTAFAHVDTIRAGGEWVVSLIYGVIKHKYRYTYMDTDAVPV